MPNPPDAAAAEPVKRKGSSLRASIQAGTEVCDSSTAVYEATPGAASAELMPAGRATARSSRAHQVPRQRAGTSSRIAAIPTPGVNAVRIHVPILIGEVGLATRSMWWNRSGRPRSETR